MRAMIRSGRCWVPSEWRPPLGLRLWECSAVIAVTGARTRTAAIGILAGHLPLLPSGDLGPHDARDPGPREASAWQAVGTAGAPSPATAGLPGRGEPESGEPALGEDTAGAQRMARRLSRVLPAKGTRELVRAGFVPLHVPAVYGWRRARHGEHVYRAWPDGSFTPVAVFRDVGVQDRDGRWRHRLVAGRPW
jgi:hypothetical protein